MAPIRDDVMRCGGIAIPLALATLGGVLTGHLASAALLQGLGLWLLVLLAARQWFGMLLTLVVLSLAGQLLMVRGGELAEGLTRQDLVLEGRLVAVSREARLSRLRLEIEACRPLDAGLPSCERLKRVRLSAFEAPDMAVGERWRLMVRLRPPTGFANPHAFDYRAWLWREGIQATGYVRRDPAPERLATSGVRLRQAALEHLASHDLEARSARWLAALTLGASERLTREDWDLLNASGTTHLMVISGLHVGLVATCMLGLCRGLARCVTPGVWRLAVWPWWLAGAAAVGYAWLAGLEPPALRAMVMTLVGLWVASGRHAPGPWQAWWLALAMVLLLDPLSAWRPGLWLSFVAVALLILVWQGRPRPRGVRGWVLALVRSQLLLAPLMAAAGLLAFSRVAPAAPLVNLIAVPLVSSLMVPLGLLGWLLAWLSPLSDLCWWLFGGLVTVLAAVLEVTVAWLPLRVPAPDRLLPLALALGAISLLWALPGLERRLRLAGSVLLVLIPLLATSPTLMPGVLRVRVHDVGQGQLVELRTAGYRALVDTGPRFGSGFMPLASLWGPGQRFDDVIVSHADLDHAGGVPALLAAHRVDRWLAPPGAPVAVPIQHCVAGLAWRRDGVEFRALWPPVQAGPLTSNDRSCVLEVRAGSHRLVVTGDAGRQVERAFLERIDGPVTVLVVGHHGSHTSSGVQLVRRLAPRHAIFSAARYNPFGHPAERVVRRFREVGSCLWFTGRDGAVTLYLGGPASSRVRAERTAPWRAGGVEGGCLALESPATDRAIR
ncbi:DNA internalization-related competence protein ComEC/Rec2 [Halomonas cerina]|uniref:Competence protein ComEC n=1 Tax=Halomonas cerina TaxID=447424 RepID=A0A839VBV0_9GAMM|nr:DNA internalization-related competence protein ComEC/Rec2 [Halomonas cerina]MBB3191588.1 competence protein ComEC [Halomonas cerina]